MDAKDIFSAFHVNTGLLLNSTAVSCVTLHEIAELQVWQNRLPSVILCWEAGWCTGYCNIGKTLTKIGLLIFVENIPKAAFFWHLILNFAILDAAFMWSREVHWDILGWMFIIVFSVISLAEFSIMHIIDFYATPINSLPVNIFLLCLSSCIWRHMHNSKLLY